MKRSIEIHLGENAQRVGTLHYNQGGNRENSSFEYVQGWIASGNSFPIEPALRLVPGPQYHKALKDGSKFHGSIADTEPDGWGHQVIMRDHENAVNDIGSVVAAICHLPTSLTSYSLLMTLAA